ncbi:MAG: hypothetical protein Q9184_008602, partial [Pyrenodesmia sp. 2 TL-2023]
KWSIDCSNKNEEEKDLIKLELENAKRIAIYGRDHIDDDSDDTKHYREGFISECLRTKPYTECFVSEGLRNIPDKYIIKQLQEQYGNGADMLGKSNNYQMKVTCDQGTQKCRDGYYAHMKANTKTMNICDAWFNPINTPAAAMDPPAPYLEKTEDILKTCKDESKTKFKTLEDFWAGKAHGSYKVGKNREFVDVDVDTKLPLCPDEEDPTVPGYCNPDLSVSNADTLAIMAG